MLLVCFSRLGYLKCEISNLDLQYVIWNLEPEMRNLHTEI